MKSYAVRIFFISTNPKPWDGSLGSFTAPSGLSPNLGMVHLGHLQHHQGFLQTLGWLTWVIYSTIIAASQ